VQEDCPHDAEVVAGDPGVAMIAAKVEQIHLRLKKQKKLVVVLTQNKLECLPAVVFRSILILC